MSTKRKTIKNRESNPKIRKYRKARRILQKRKLGILWDLARPFIPLVTLLWFLKKKSFLIWLSLHFGDRVGSQQTKQFQLQSKQEIQSLHQNLHTQAQNSQKLEEKLRQNQQEKEKLEIDLDIFKKERNEREQKNEII
jgi:hypothetical protein